MAKKVNLPFFEEPASSRPPPGRPSIDAARSRLGGRVPASDWPSGLAPGVAVTFGAGSGAATGVIVFASATEVHVLLDGIRLRRLSPDEVELHEGSLSIALEKISGDARLFGRLVEGEAVRYADESGTMNEGKMLEKCRWGALVRRDDGAIVAVGFRKLWPIVSQQGSA